MATQNLWSELFKEQSNQSYHKRVALLKRSYIQYAFRLNLRNLDVKVYINEFLHWCNFLHMYMMWKSL